MKEEVVRLHITLLIQFRKKITYTDKLNSHTEIIKELIR